ncbi:unnamed protein product [Effrenium voratum]|nr:unnamed protein product [Effrenium voratum]
METLSFLGQRAFEVMPPLRALEATVAYIHQDAEGIAQLAISAVSREGLNFSTWQAAYAAFSLAGHNTSFAIAAAVEAVKQLGGHRDQAIALMPDILLLNGLSQAEARMELVSFALLPAALEALAQAFQRFELFREGWQAERYAILTDFEGEENAMYTSLREAQKAFQSPSAAVAAALANGEASQLLRYLIASGYSSQQALQLMAQADNASLQEAGAQLSSSLRLGFLHPTTRVGRQSVIAEAELRQFLRTKCGNLKAAFTDLDLTETGQLKREDFEAGLQRLGFPQDCAELWKQLDRQKQGVVNQRSFVSGLEDSYPGRAFHPGMNTPRKFECLAPTLLQRLTPNASNASVAGAIAGSEKGSGKSSSSSPRKAPLEERVRRLEEQLAHEQEKRRALEADLPHRFREILREELQELRQQVAADAATASSASVSVSPKRPTFAFSANIGTRRSFPGSDEREELQHCRLLSSVSDKHLDLRAASASVETPSIQEEERGKQVAPSTALRQENLQLREQLLALREQAVEAKEREKAKRQSHSPPNLQRSERRESRGVRLESGASLMNFVGLGGPTA